MSTSIQYQPQLRKQGTAEWNNYGSPISATNVTVSGLTSGTTFEFQVLATDIFGTTPSNVRIDSTTGSGSGSTIGDAVGVTAFRIADFMERFGVNTFSSPGPSTNSWAISSGGQVTVNGAVDSTTSVVAVLAEIDGKICQRNTAGLWWHKILPFDLWQPAAGTTTSPVPANILIAGLGGTLTDNSGNTWSINASRQVAVNNVADTTTANVIVLAKVNGQMWQRNLSGLWWAKTVPTDVWSPGPGTTTSPILPTQIIVAGSTDSIVSTVDNDWGSYPSNYTTGPVIDAVNFLTAGSGLTMQLRERHYAVSTWQSSWCPTVAAGTGCTFSIAIGSDGSVSDVASLISMAASSSNGTGWLKWIEGVNEPNGDLGNGIVPVATTVAVQQALWSNAQSLSTNPFPVTVVGPSVNTPAFLPEDAIFAYVNNPDLSTIISNSSVCNAHPYPIGECDIDEGTGRGGLIGTAVVGLNTAYPGQPMLITEWHPTRFNFQNHVLDPTYDAYYAPLFCLSAFRAGFLGWFWATLFDFGTNQATGLFPLDASNPRPAANVIRAMYSLTGDHGTTKRSFTVGKLDFTVSGLPAPLANSPNSGGQTMLFQKSDGTFFLYVWNAQADPGGAAVQVGVNFNSHQMTSVTEYNLTSNPSANTTPVQSLNSVHSMTLSLSASVHLLVIKY